MEQSKPQRSKRAQERGPVMSKKKQDKPDHTFFNHLTFSWNDSHRLWEATGLVTRFPTNPMHWWVDVTSRACEFERNLQEEFGVIPSWVTIKDAEAKIEECRTYAVFDCDPHPMFLRRWLDTWVHANYARIWMHVREFLRLQKGVKETDAEKRATEIGTAFYALFLEPVPVEKPKQSSHGKTEETKPEQTPESAPEQPAPVPLGVPDGSRLCRNREQDTLYRDIIEKFEKGSNLRDEELKMLLRLYAGLFRMTELFGPRYFLMREEAHQQYERLVHMGRDRGWDDAVYAMLMVGVEDRLTQLNR